MTTCIGFLLLLGIVVGGIHLYFKVERLDRMIAKQDAGENAEADDERT